MSQAKKTINPLQQVKALAVFVIVFLIASFIYRTFNLNDHFKNFGYTPPESISTIEDKLALTNKAKTIFHATRPQLESRDDFNQHCDSNQDEQVSILGCYVNSTIYLYDVQSTELPGVVESTAAHELLHAVWARLNFWEKSSLESELLAVYQAHTELLSNDLELYDEADRLDELHSRIGVEIKDLPDKLEQHYAQFFADQDAIVDFYNSYSEPFKQLSAEIDALAAELETMRAEIDTRTQDYYQKSEDLAARIATFNDCANTLGCFANDNDFYAQRGALSAEQDNLEDEYYDLNALIDQYNQKVDLHNANILRTHTLENAINSNAPINNLED